MLNVHRLSQHEYGKGSEMIRGEACLGMPSLRRSTKDELENETNDSVNGPEDRQRGNAAYPKRGAAGGWAPSAETQGRLSDSATSSHRVSHCLSV